MIKPTTSSNSISNEFTMPNFIVAKALVGSWSIDITTKKATWNHLTKKIYETPLDYMPSLDECFQFFKEGKNRKKIINSFKKCIKHFENFDEVLQIITARGNEKWIRIIGHADIENGTTKKIYGTFQDIEKKNDNRKKVTLQEKDFRKTFEFASIGMAIVNLKGKWLKVNKSLCNMLGYSEKQLLKLSHNDITHHSDLDISKHVINHIKKGNLDSLDVEKKYIHKNCSIIYANLLIAIVNSDEGKPTHYVYQIKDITNIKTARDEINELLEVSEKQNKQLLNFAHIVSHNLRSHFSNMEMLSNLMELKTPSATKNEMFPLLKEAINHLGETIDNLNQITLIQADENINIIKANLFDVVQASLASIKSDLIINKAEIKIKIDKSIYVKVIPAYLDNIIMNLLTNSLKYRSPKRNLKLEISAEIKENSAIIKFKDNGLGIDLNLHKNKVFGMYNTFHNHKDSKGVGLFNTKHQIESLGGSINIESEVDKGTTFIISLKV